MLENNSSLMNQSYNWPILLSNLNFSLFIPLSIQHKIFCSSTYMLKSEKNMHLKKFHQKIAKK